MPVDIRFFPPLPKSAPSFPCSVLLRTRGQCSNNCGNQSMRFPSSLASRERTVRYCVSTFFTIQAPIQVLGHLNVQPNLKIAHVRGRDHLSWATRPAYLAHECYTRRLPSAHHGSTSPTRVGFKNILCVRFTLSVPSKGRHSIVKIAVAVLVAWK